MSRILFWHNHSIDSSSLIARFSVDDDDHHTAYFRPFKVAKVTSITWVCHMLRVSVCVRARVFTGRRKKKRKSGKRNGGIGWDVHAALRSKIHLKLTVAVHFHFFVVSTLLLSFGINNRCMWLTRCASTSLMIYHNCPFCRYLHIWGKWKQLHIVFRNFHFWFSKHPINDTPKKHLPIVWLNLTRVFDCKNNSVISFAVGGEGSTRFKCVS